AVFDTAARVEELELDVYIGRLRRHHLAQVQHRCMANQIRNIFSNPQVRHLRSVHRKKTNPSGYRVGKRWSTVWKRRNSGSHLSTPFKSNISGPSAVTFSARAPFTSVKAPGEPVESC